MIQQQQPAEVVQQVKKPPPTPPPEVIQQQQHAEVVPKRVHEAPASVLAKKLKPNELNHDLFAIPRGPPIEKHQAESIFLSVLVLLIKINRKRCFSIEMEIFNINRNQA